MATELSQSIFFHLPRTGGTWIVKLFQSNLEYSNIGSKHISPKQFDRRGGTSKFKFSFARNPLNWYISKFSSPTHIQRLRSNNQLTHTNINPIFEIDALNIKEPFRQWLRRIIEEHPSWLTNYYSWFYGKNYQYVDYIGTYENQLKDLKKIFTLSNQDFKHGFFREAHQMPFMGPKKRLLRKEKCKYTKHLIKSVIDSEIDLFKKFGYSTNVNDYLHLC